MLVRLRYSLGERDASLHRKYNMNVNLDQASATSGAPLVAHLVMSSGEQQVHSKKIEKIGKRLYYFWTILIESIFPEFKTLVKPLH